MLVYLAEDASTAVGRYTGIDVPFTVRLLLTAKGKPNVRAKNMAEAYDGMSPDSVFIDSGAYGHVKAAYSKKGRAFSESDVEKFLLQHLGSCKWMVDNGYQLSAVAEMDLPDMYSQDLINRWREEYMYKFQEETGVPVVFGFHGTEDLYALVENPEVHYIGMSVSLGKKRIEEELGSVKEYYRLLAQVAMMCYERGIMFHGYAVTRNDVMKQVPFYSCDSASWQHSIHWGGAAVFDQATGKLTRVDAGKRLVSEKGAKAVVKNIIKLHDRGSDIRPNEVIGRVDKKGKLRRDYKEIFRTQAKVYADMERYHTKFWKLKNVNWKKQLSKHGRHKVD